MMIVKVPGIAAPRPWPGPPAGGGVPGGGGGGGPTSDAIAKIWPVLLSNAIVRAPFDGHVFYGQMLHGTWATADQVMPFLHTGERLQPGQVLLTVCGLRTRAVADVPEAEYFDVSNDMGATITPTAMPDAKREGVVRGKSLVAQTKGQAAAFEAVIEIKDPPTELFPGMKGKATLKGKELEGVVFVPAKAVSSEGGKHTVKVSTNTQKGESTPREVTVGKSDGKMIQIKSGLEAGDKVCVPK
jgi:multidrug efflux pump subunit AcrA (membrane-fusion protein)